MLTFKILDFLEIFLGPKFRNALQSANVEKKSALSQAIMELRDWNGFSSKLEWIPSSLEWIHSSLEWFHSNLNSPTNHILWGGLSCSHDLYSCSQLSNYCSAAAHCNWYLVAPAAENNPNLFKHSSIFNYEWLHNKLNPGKQSWKKIQNTIMRRLQNVDMDRTFYTVHTGQAMGNCWLV